MEKREPYLVPEWLTSRGHSSGGGSKNHILSSSARSDSSLSQSWNSRTKSDVDSVRSRFSSTNTPRGFSNASTKNAYSSFNFQKRYKYRLSYIDRDTSFPFDTLLRRSNSRKQGDQLAQGFTMGLKNGRSNNNIYNRNGTRERNGGPQGWTSALAEVIDKSGSGSVGNSVTLTGQTCRNMAKALVQAPRIHTPPQGSSKIQILEDRALKESRQLIPVVPSKGSVLNSFDKSKTKPMTPSGETHQQSSVLLGNLHTNHGSQIKGPDTTKKLVLLKPARENGVYAVKESGSPSRTGYVQTTNNPRELREASVNMLVEKKLSLAPTQSRSAFYSALKKKTSTNISTDPSKTSSCICSSVEENADISKELVAIDRSSVYAAERDEKVYEVAERNNGFELAERPDEKEAEFLKSLGWDENNIEEDEAPLTEEEIRAFIEQCKKLKPSLVQKLPII